MRKTSQPPAGVARRPAWGCRPAGSASPGTPRSGPGLQVREIAFQVRLVIPPRHPIDSGGGVLLRFEERRLETSDADVVEERRELLLPITPCGLP